MINERLISCFICDNFMHLKCAGFNGRQYDFITDKTKGLRWSCFDCRDLQVDYHCLFKETKAEIDKLKKSFNLTFKKFKNWLTGLNYLMVHQRGKTLQVLLAISKQTIWVSII